MDSIGTYVSNFVTSAFSNILPNRVDEYTYDQYVAKYLGREEVERKEDSFCFYKIANHFDMIYFSGSISNEDKKDVKIFSLFRFQGELDIGLFVFAQYAYVIATLAEVKTNGRSDAQDRAWLERVTDLCRTHISWSVPHIAASIDFREAFTCPRILKELNVSEEEQGFTPLRIAVNALNAPLVSVLLQLEGIDWAAADLSKNTILHAATTTASPLLLQTVLSHLGATVRQTDNCGVVVGDVEAAALSAFVNATNLSGMTALHIACQLNNLECVRLLLKARADPLAGTAVCFPIHYAVENDSLDCVKLLCEAVPMAINQQRLDTRETGLHLTKNVKMLDYLVTSGAELNLRNSEGQTVLHLKVHEQDADAVFNLLVRMADPNEVDKSLASPLHYAVQRGLNIDVIRALIVFEADVNAEDAEGFTPRHWLCKHSAGKYQHSKARDLALYTLDAVDAKRCPPQRTNCTAGCRTHTRLAPKLSKEPILQPSGVFSVSAMLTLLPDFAIGNNATAASSEDLFNGTPPTTIISPADLEHDLDHDLFSCVTPGMPSSPARHNSLLVGSSTEVTHRLTRPARRSLGTRHPSLRVPLSGRRSTLATSYSMVGVAGERTLAAEPELTRKPNSLTCLADKVERLHEVPSSEYEQDNTTAHPDGVRFTCGSLPVAEPLETHQAPPSEPPYSYPRQKSSVGFVADIPHLTTSAVNPASKWSRHFPYCSAAKDAVCCQARFACQLKRTASEDSMTQTTSTTPVVAENISVADWSTPTADVAVQAAAAAQDNLDYDGASSYSQPDHTSFSDSDGSDVVEEPTKPALDSDGFPYGPHGYRVLTLDGGGIRGLILCQVLRAVEREAGRPIREMFDWFIGTSTGALLALDVAQGKCVRYVRSLYIMLKDRIFAGKRPYDSNGVETFICNEFGLETRMTDLRPMRIAVTTLLSDRFPPRLHLFRNYPSAYMLIRELLSVIDTDKAEAAPSVAANKSKEDADSMIKSITTYRKLNPEYLQRIRHLFQAYLSDGFEVVEQAGDGSDITGDEEGDGKDKGNDSEGLYDLLTAFCRSYINDSNFSSPDPIDKQPVWVAARASSAAPTFFRASGPYLDGGLIAANPTLDLLTEVQELNLVRRLLHEPLIPIGVVASIGTGRIPVRQVTEIDVFRPQSPIEAYRSVMGMSALGRILVEMATMSEGRIVERSRAWCNSMSVPFFRFSPMLSEDVPLDCVENRTLLHMLWETEVYLCRCRGRIRRLVKLLVA